MVLGQDAVDLPLDHGQAFARVDHRHRQAERSINAFHLGEVGDLPRPADIGDCRQEGVLINGPEKDVGAEQERLFSSQGKEVPFRPRLPRVLDLKGPAVPLDGPPLPLGVEEVERPFMKLHLALVSGVVQSS
jgi:hypothetical protein